MLPSEKQKYIAALRSHALQQGLHVKLPVSLGFPEGCDKSSHPYYCLQRKLKPGQPFIHLIRDDRGVHLSSAQNSIQRDFLTQVLLNLSKNYDAIYIGNGLIGLSWDEAKTENIQLPQELIDTLGKIENFVLNGK